MFVILCFVVAMLAAASAQAQVCVNGVCAMPSRVSMQWQAVQPLSYEVVQQTTVMAPQDLPAIVYASPAPEEFAIVHRSTTASSPVQGCACVQADGVCACAMPSVMGAVPTVHGRVFHVHGTSNRPLPRVFRGAVRPVGRVVLAPFRALRGLCGGCGR